MAFTGTLSTNGPMLLVQGAMELADPAAYLSEQIAMMKSPAYQA
jgi:hypothetical protein